MIVTIKFVCLFTFHETSLTLCNSIQKCTTRLEYSLSGSTRLVNFFGHDQRHVLFVLFGIHQSFYLEFQNISISHCVYQGSTQNCVFFCLLGFHPKLFFLLFIRVPPQIVFVITGFHPFLNRFFFIASGYLNFSNIVIFESKQFAIIQSSKVWEGCESF